MSERQKYTIRDLSAECAGLRAEIERLRGELLDAHNHEIALATELHECRRLLREACQDPERVEVSGVRCWEIVVADEWFVAARAAGGRE